MAWLVLCCKDAVVLIELSTNQVALFAPLRFSRRRSSRALTRRHCDFVWPRSGRNKGGDKLSRARGFAAALLNDSRNISQLITKQQSVCDKSLSFHQSCLLQAVIIRTSIALRLSCDLFPFRGSRVLLLCCMFARPRLVSLLFRLLRTAHRNLCCEETDLQATLASRLALAQIEAH